MECMWEAWTNTTFGHWVATFTLAGIVFMVYCGVRGVYFGVPIHKSEYTE